ncbi:MAG: 23S rRNA (pseudouridine(1915)-N(3))-methyltransferase RlmH [Deltaproteobacteria bacterium]|nr:23S rRNA (pseudouridine(1915)-N(3))-methyltransferase RlmH [Deltaproteobacteria bacterium]
MRFRIAAVGKVREPYLRRAIDEYLGRIGHYARCEEVEVAGASALARAVPERYSIVALDPAGKQLTSEAFAAWIGDRMNRSEHGLAFLIGGADGLPGSLVARASLKLSLSTMTLPHRLARLFLAEQLYRAMTILRGEKYAR